MLRVSVFLYLFIYRCAGSNSCESCDLPSERDCWSPSSKMCQCQCQYLFTCPIVSTINLSKYVSTDLSTCQHWKSKLITSRPIFFLSPASMSCMCWSRSLAAAMDTDSALLCSSSAVERAWDALRNWFLTADSSDLPKNKYHEQIQITFISSRYDSAQSPIHKSKYTLEIKILLGSQIFFLQLSRH